MRGPIGGGGRTVLVAAAPVAAAISVFGTIYGASARAVASPAEIIASSVLVFSGAVQFTFVGLLLAGAPTVAILATAAMLNARHLLLGAALRGKLRKSRPKRALLAWWLIDETAGLALAPDASAARVLLMSGVLCYSAWVVGTGIGVLGASLAPLEGLAAAVFPVLFVGLAALSVVDRDGALRAGAAAVASLLFAIAFPQARSVAPVIAAVMVALPEGKR